MRLQHLSILRPRYDTLSCSSGAKMLQGAPMSDAPRRPPPLPQNALLWLVVAALVLVLVRAAWRGLF
jgi:hypothetical protein